MHVKLMAYVPVALFFFVFVSFLVLQQVFIPSILLCHGPRDLEPAHVAMAAIMVKQLRLSPQAALELLLRKYFEWDLTETLDHGRGTAALTRQGESPQTASLL